MILISGSAWNWCAAYFLTLDDFFADSHFPDRSLHHPLVSDGAHLLAVEIYTTEFDLVMTVSRTPHLQTPGNLG